MAIEFGRTGPRWPVDLRLHDEPARGPATSKRTGRSVETAPPNPALRAAAEYSRSDLARPDRLEAMLRSSARELVERNAGAARMLSDGQKDQVVERLAGDPVMRKRLEQYLSKVLK